MIRADDDRAAFARKVFIRALEAVAVDVLVVPGRLVLIDNRCMLHGRRGYEASFTAEGAPYPLAAAAVLDRPDAAVRRLADG